MIAADAEPILGWHKVIQHQHSSVVDTTPEHRRQPTSISMGALWLQHD
jgi:hypothetical protein